jgi:integrase
MKVVMRDGTGTRDYKFVVEEYDRHDNLRTYLRRRGRPKVRLRETVGTPEFDAEYLAALESSHNALESKRRIPAGRESFRWLVEQYYRSSDFRQLDEIETQPRRRTILDDLCEKYGHLSYKKLKTSNVRTMRDAKVETPVAANNLVKDLRQLFKWAIDAEHVDSNPARDVNNLKPKNPGGWHTVTEDEIAQYEATHPVGTMARLALGLFLYAGGPRNSDTFRLGKQHISKPTANDPLGRIRYTQHKGRNKKPIEIDNRILPELKELIDASPCGDLTFLISEHGRPFASAASFGNKVKKWFKEAGLPHCSGHGLRKASACRLVEYELTDFQIMVWNGWTSLRQVQNYTREMRRKLIADKAAVKIEAGQKLNKSVPLSGGGDGSGTIKVKKA